MVKLSFKDRHIGMFELGEQIILCCDADAIGHVIEIRDGWGRVVNSYKIESGETALEGYGVGWYRIYVKDENGEKVESEYIAYTVTVPYASRYKGETCFATDIAGEYEPLAIQLADEVVRGAKLQGFELARGRSSTYKWSESLLEYRKKLKAGGMKTLNVMMNGYESMPKIRELNLFDMYKTFRDAPELNEVENDIVEFCNEPDFMRSLPALPDALAAYQKMSFIGVADSKGAPYACMSGLALGRDDIYSDIYLQNGILDYSAFYNFHGYDQLKPLSTYARKVSLAYSPKGQTVPSYMTENGKKVWCGEDDVVYDDQILEMSKYAVKASTELLSDGVDKWFWFISRAFLEAGGGFGSYHAWTHQPYSCTAALANLTYQLGKGEYVGVGANLPEKCQGYYFNNGEGSDVAVFWSKKTDDVELIANSAVVVDLFGAEKTVLGDGKIKIEVSEYPIFVKFGCRCDEKNYYKTSYKLKPIRKPVLDVAHRVVLNALWDDQDLSQAMIMQKGYLMAEGGVEHITLRIYNANDKSVKGRAYVKTEYAEHFEIEIENDSFEIAPFDCGYIKITLKCAKNCMNSSGDIKFGAILEEYGETTPAVCRYWFKAENMPIADCDIVKFEDVTDISRWDLTNICAPGYIEAESDEVENSVTLHINHGDGYAQWFFPVLTIKNPEALEGTDGIFLRKKNSFETANSNKLTVFLLTRDGRAYWSGHSSAFPTSEDWKNAIYPWETFGLYSSPEGFNDVRPLVPSEIYKIRVGVSGTSSKKIPDFTIKDLGGYHDRFGATNPHPEQITFEGACEGERFESAQGLKLTAILPDRSLSDIRVFDGSCEIDEYKISGNRVEIDASGFKRGLHTLQVSGKSETEYRYAGIVTFYVE